MARLRTSTHPLFSLVIPAYNEEALLGACLKSLSAQKTTASYEVVVVDNNSSDNTAAIAREHGARVVSERHPGVCWARQAGLEAAKGSIIISTDADTTYRNDWLETIHRHFQSEHIVAVGGPVTYTGDIWWANVWSNVLFGFSTLWAKIFGQPAYVSACNLAFRKNAVSGYETNLTQGGDELAILKQLKPNGKVIIDRSNTVFTSGRRQSQGFLYTVFVTFVWYYLLGYMLSRLTHRTVFGGYPAFRDFRKRTHVMLIQRATQMAVFGVIAGALIIGFHLRPSHVAQFFERVPSRVVNVLLDKDI